eukprot:XP_020397088.1 nucleophosmin-like [Zea mays]
MAEQADPTCPSPPPRATTGPDSRDDATPAQAAQPTGATLRLHRARPTRAQAADLVPMVRTLQTTRINTNYAPQPRQIPVYPVVVEEVPADLPPIRVENVVILEDSSEEQLPTPTPLAESLAFVARSSTSAPPAPAFQAPAPGGDDPNDSGDDDDEDDDDEEGEDEQVNEEADYA